MLEPIRSCRLVVRISGLDTRRQRKHHSIERRSGGQLHEGLACRAAERGRPRAPHPSARREQPPPELLSLRRRFWTTREQTTRTYTEEMLYHSEGRPDQPTVGARPARR